MFNQVQCKMATIQTLIGILMLHFFFFKRKLRKKLVVSKYFIIFAIKNIKSGEYGFDS